MAEVYGDFGDFKQFWAAKNKPKQTQFYLAPRFIWDRKVNLKKQSQFLYRRPDSSLIMMDLCKKGN